MIFRKMQRGTLDREDTSDDLEIEAVGHCLDLTRDAYDEMATAHGLPTLRARREAWKASKEEERNRRCPHCGGETAFAHWLFNKGHWPPGAWLHTCKRCKFSAYLTGDREKDLKAQDFFEQFSANRGET
ncbi:hypothetical protein [Salipiger aestuarii]|uniref:hypothetical protein n=1 Tax=Salipiger aestuarii TaxID=568098 RepID=UPI00168077DF|nr:hypothetical protein [Salipiger aestuarii]